MQINNLGIAVVVLYRYEHIENAYRQLPNPVFEATIENYYYWSAKVAISGGRRDVIRWN